jgi:hypothetical protein
MGNSSDSTSSTNQTTKSTANSLTNFLSNMAKQYASNTSQNTASMQTYSPSDIAKALISRGTTPITSEQLQQYQSPYQKQVIDATMAQLEQQYGQQQSALKGNAISQNALGGDRAKIAQAALMGEQGRNTASTIAGLNQQGYTQAMANAQADQNRLLQAAGISGGTTTGGSQMTGQTAGSETGQTSGTSASAQTGTSHTVGSSKSNTTSDPTIFGMDTGFLGNVATGGAIRKRDSGGEVYGIPSWAMPPPMQSPPPLQSPAQHQQQQGKTMSTQEMFKLGDKARTQLSKIFSSEGSGAGADMTSAGSSDALGMGSSGSGADLSSLFGSFGGSGAGAGEAAAATSEAAAGAGEAAAGAGEAAGALGKGAAGAGEAAAGAGAGIGEGIGALAALFSDERVKENKRKVGQLYDGQNVYAFNYKGHPATHIGLMAQEVERRHPEAVGEAGGVKTVQYDQATQGAADRGHFSEGGLVSRRAGGGGMSMPGFKMSKGVGQEWFDVPTMDPTSGIKGSEGAANGGVIRHRYNGGETDQEAPSFLIEQEKQLEEARKLREERAAKEAAISSSEDVGPSGPAPVKSVASEIGDWARSYMRPSPNALTPREVDERLNAEKAALAEAPKPSIADLAPKPFETSVEPVPIQMKTTVPIDTETGKDIDPMTGKPSLAGLVKPAPEGASNLAEPGAEEIAPDKQINPAQAMVSTLRANGASDSTIQGILANTQHESGFNPGLVGKGDQRGRFKGDANDSHGLFQFGGDNWTMYNAWIAKDHPDADWRDPALQTEFLAHHLQVNQPGTWKRMQEASPEEAAQIFLHEYEKPAKKHADSRHEQYGRGVLSIDEYTSMPSSVTTSERPSSRSKEASSVQAPREGDQSLAALVPTSQAAPSGASAPAQPQAAPGAQEGNILTRILGAGLNPLKMSDKDLGFIAQAALGGMGGINNAMNTAQGTRQQDIQAQQHAVQMAMEAQKLQHTLAQPVVTGENYDINTGTWHKQYSTLNKQTGQYDLPAMTPGPRGLSGQTQIADIAPDKSGDEFMSEARKSGYSSAILSDAKRVAEYKVDPSKLAGIKGEQRQILDRLASRINPDYEGSKYAAVADSEKKLASGDVAKSLRSVGRLADEIFQAHKLAGETGNTRSEYANQAAGSVYPSGSKYGIARTNLGTALNNVYDSASAVAKGGGTSAEGDVKRRSASMNMNMAPEALQGGLKTELEVGMKNGQSNLTSWNNARGYTPDNPKYKTVMDNMTPNQQKNALELLGPDKIEEITGKPVKGASEKSPSKAPVSAGARPVGKSNAQLLSDAQEAIKHGIPKEKVYSQLDEWGVSH